MGGSLLEIEATAYLLSRFEALQHGGDWSPRTPDELRSAAQAIGTISSEHYRTARNLEVTLAHLWRSDDSKARVLDNLLRLSENLFQTFQTKDGLRFTLDCEKDVGDLARRRLPLTVLLAALQASAGAAEHPDGPQESVDAQPPDGPHESVDDLAATSARSDPDPETDRGADGHVHIGTAVPFVGLLFLAIARMQRRNRVEEIPIKEMLPWAGGFYRLDALLGGARLAFGAMWQFLQDTDQAPRSMHEYLADAPRTRSFPAELVDALKVDGGLWKIITDAATWAPKAQPGGAARMARTWIESMLVGIPPDPDANYLSQLCQDLGKCDCDPRLAWPCRDAEDIASGVLVRLLTYYYRNPTDLVFSHHIVQLIRFFCLIHQAVTPGARPGLDVFVQHFDRQGALRERGLASIRTGGGGRSTVDEAETVELARHSLVVLGLRYLNQGRDLAKVELRMSVDKDTAGTRASNRAEWSADRSGLGGTALAHLEAYKHYVDALHAMDGKARPPEVAFAFSLIKRRAPDPSIALPGAANRRSLRPSLGNLFDVTRGARVIAEFLAAYPSSAWRFFRTVDVAGDEESLPNWVFTLSLEQLVERLQTLTDWGPGVMKKIMFTFHAGESFDYPVQGLRRIDEILQHAPQVSRLGHGVALGWSQAAWREDVNAQELLDDLVWVWAKLPELDQTSCPSKVNVAATQARIAEEAQRIAGKLYECDPGTLDLATLWTAYEQRFSRQTMRNVAGLISDEITGSGWRFGDTVRPDLLEEEGDWGKILCRYLTDKRLDWESVSVRGIRELLEGLYEPVRQSLLSDIHAKGMVVECCPTSNLRVADIPDYSQHPIFNIRRIDGTGVPVKATVNTDNPGMFHVQLKDEFEAVYQAAHQHYPEGDQAITWLGQVRRDGVETFGPWLDGMELTDRLDEAVTELGDR